MSKYSFIIFFLISSILLSGQATIDFNSSWQISNRHSIVLNLDSIQTLPHADNIEMSGKNISSIIYYQIDEERNLSIEKDIIFPQLRTYNKSNEPDWKKYRAYFRKKINESFSPAFQIGEQTIIPSKLDSIEIGGMLTFYYTPIKGLKFSKTIFPSMDKRLLVEEWSIENISDTNRELLISEVKMNQCEYGFKGKYSFLITSPASEIVDLKVGNSYSYPVYFAALLNDEKSDNFKAVQANKLRIAFLNTCRKNLVFESPDQVLNTMFYFAKIRAAESIYHSSMGLVHSPGGGNYYVGIWANDQIEYSGPFFPFMGYETADIASYNAYKKFLENIPLDDGHIPYAFEVDGNFPMTHLDRGDAAMIAYGTAQYLLNTGSLEKAKSLWPLLEWALDYCHRNRNKLGAVMSESDEMEGRIETGSANLSTSSLYYGGLKRSISVAKALNLSDRAIIYKKRLSEMENVIENYFGTTIDGIETYRYFDGNEYLRHWICLPLSMGITNRKEGTLKALFEKLWTQNGILVEYNPTKDTEKNTFWDRATLYALKAALKFDQKNIAFERLKEYTNNRLLGKHVPYAVEAYPENNMKHLSAESALYCRVFIEGLLGIESNRFSHFNICPTLPYEWNYIEMNRLFMHGKPIDIKITREGQNLRLLINSEKKQIYNKVVQQKELVQIKL